MLEWNTKHFRLNLQSSLTLSNFRDAGVGFELRNQKRHCKTVCIKSTLYLINYNRIRTKWTTKGNRDAGSSYSCGRGLHRYLRNFGEGGVEHPKRPPLGTPLQGSTHSQQKPVHRSTQTCSGVSYLLKTIKPLMKDLTSSSTMYRGKELWTSRNFRLLKMDYQNVTKYRAPINRWCNATSQKKGDVNSKPAKL